jgi:hypothetical protein
MEGYNMDALTYMEKVAVIIGNLFICGGVFIALFQLFFAKKRKEQATLEYYQKIRKELNEARKNISKKLPNNEIIKVYDYEKDGDFKDAINEYLSHIERFATGINKKFYDIEVFYDMIGLGVIRMHGRLKDIISHNRKTINPIACKDLEKLVPKLKYLQKKKYFEEFFDFATHLQAKDVPKQDSISAKIEEKKI